MIILCRVVWAEHYESMSEKMFAGNMKYPKKTGDAGELQNFKNVNGNVYGFVQHNDSRIILDHLYPKAEKTLTGVTVIWVAVDPKSRELRVVGWYLNATVRELPIKPAPKLKRSGYEYQFSASASDATLLGSADRFLRVPTRKKRTDKGYIGQRNWFFPLKSKKYAEFLEGFSLLVEVYGSRLSKTNDASLDFEQVAYIEGQKYFAEVCLSSRNQKLVAAAKQSLGLSCQVCNFNFFERYGLIGKDFIEVHHIVPISSVAKNSASLKDVNVVCSNCHRMLHKRSPPMSIEELRSCLVS